MIPAAKLSIQSRVTLVIGTAAWLIFGLAWSGGLGVSVIVVSRSWTGVARLINTRMNPDVMVSEGRVGDGRLDAGHVTWEATSFRAHRASRTACSIRSDGPRGRRSRCTRMTNDAFFFVECRRLLSVTVRIVTSQAVESTAALFIALTPRQGRARKAYCDGIILRNLSDQWAMALRRVRQPVRPHRGWVGQSPDRRI